MITLTYFGHSAFLISTNNGTIIIDPFIQSTDNFNPNPLDIKVDAILLTHGHGDHLGQTMEISLNCKAPVITTFELANYLAGKDLKTHAMHLGGTSEFSFGKVKLFPALHGGGLTGEKENKTPITPCGFIYTAEEKSIYHAGDTALTKEMELLGDYFTIDLALLPIGGKFTMDIADALIATSLIKPKMVIPMHYNTFPSIQADAEKFVAEIQKKGLKAQLLKPGEKLEL